MFLHALNLIWDADRNPKSLEHRDPNIAPPCVEHDASVAFSSR
jgi:hypothetical protein